METQNSHALSVVRNLSYSIFRERRPPTTWEDHDVTFLDLTPLKLAPGYFVPFLVPRKAPASKDASHARRLLNTAWTYSRASGTNLCVIAVDERVEPSDSDLNFASRYGVAILDGQAQAGLGDLRDRDGASRALASTLVQYVGRLGLSPYLPGKPVSGGRFFGRQQTLAQLTGISKSNYTILGTRRIGKTSLLQQLKGSLELYYDDVNSVFLNAQMCQSSVDLEQQLAIRLDSRNARAVYSGKWINKYLIQKQVRARNTVIFVDELDHAIRVDSQEDYRFLSLLRLLGEEERCQIFLAGSYFSIRACRQIGTPLFNFTQPLFLGPLTESETVDMVTRPLTMLGINLVGSDLPDAIFRNTRGYPELIQICCAKAVRTSCDEPLHPMTSGFLATLLPSRLFQERVVKVFRENTREIERIVFSALLEDARTARLHSDGYTFGPAEIKALLDRQDIDLPLYELDDILLNLELTSAIQRLPGTAGRYRFGLPALVDARLSEPIRHADRAMSKSVRHMRTAEQLTAYREPQAARESGYVAGIDQRLPTESSKKDFFISYTKTDERWASWIAWVLEEAGYSTVLQCWDFTPGANFISAMHDALENTQRTIIVLSEEYISSAYCRAEWTAAFARDPVGAARRLIPFRVGRCDPPGLIKAMVYLDLFGMSEDEARAALLGAFEVRRKPDQEPHFPADESVTFPSTGVPFSRELGTSLPAPRATEGHVQSALERVELQRLLTDIPVEIFNMLIFALRPRAGSVAFMPVSQEERATQLIDWAGGRDGCGLAVVSKVLDELTTKYFS